MIFFQNSELTTFEEGDAVEDSADLPHNESTESEPKKSLEISHEVSDQSSDKSDDESIDPFDGKLNKFEPFGGNNEDDPQKDKKLHRSKTSILGPVRGPNQKVPLLKNGHSSTSGIPKIESKYACGFDSVVFIYAVAYADYPSVGKEINRLAKPGSFEEVIEGLFVSKETAILNKRNDWLKRLYTDDTEKKT